LSRDRVRLLHIRDAIQRIHSYVSDRDSFLTQPVIQDAVIHNLEVIGEAVKVLVRRSGCAGPRSPGAI
jgi:uncharacterized protein with HEPN domain